MQVEVTLTSNKIFNIKLYRYLQPEIGLLQAKNYIESFFAGEDRYAVQVTDVTITPKSIHQYLKDNGLPEQTVRISSFGTRDPLTSDGWRVREQELIDEILRLRTTVKQNGFNQEAYNEVCKQRDEAEADLRDADRRIDNMDGEIRVLKDGICDRDQTIMNLQKQAPATSSKPAPFLIMYDGQTMRVWENLAP